MTEATKVSAPLTAVDAELGETVTDTSGGGSGLETVTVATAQREGSATLVATTWKVPADAGALYLPEASMVPPPLSRTDQLTALDWPPDVPDTVAAKRTVAPVVVLTVAGLTETEIPGAAPETVTVASPDRVRSATLVATTWKVPGVAGAV
jgi:hypothetical protein